MKAWFFGLQLRERWILGAGAAAGIAILIWWLLLAPVMAEAELLRTSVETKQRLLVEVAEVESAQPGRLVASSQGREQTLVVIVSNTAASYGLGEPRTRQNGPSGIDVTLQGVAFDSLAAWLVALHDGYGIDVETASFSSAREPGLVNGQLSLHRL
jgi:type II secretory pathway component PulM